MLLTAGTHTLRRDDEPNRPCIIDYACVSAPVPSRLRVWIENDLIEDVHVAPYSPHTWWSSNPLLGRGEPAPGQTVTVEVGTEAVFRLEGNLVLIT